MSQHTVFMPNFSIGADVYELVGQLCAPHGASAVIIGGKTAMEKALPYLLPQVEKAGISITGQLWYGGEAAYEHVETLKADPAVQDAQMIFAVGGGKCVDTCKVVADQLHKPVFTFPTISSNCAPCTMVCVMYEKDGIYKENYYAQKPPVHTLICSRVIAEAPEIYLWAGIGDSLSKEVETSFTSRNDELDHSHGVGIAIGHACTLPLLRYGEAAMAAARQHDISHELEQVILDIIISTGLVSNLISGKYNTSLGHSIYYALSSYHRPGKKERLHGELVAYGTLLLFLADGQRDMFEKVYALASAINLPTCLADLEIDAQELPVIIEKMIQTKDVEYGAYQFTYDMVYQAVMELEKYHAQKGAAR